MTLPPETVAELIRAGRHTGPVEVRGRLDLTGFGGETLPVGLHCYELDASGSNLTCLPDDIRVDGRLVLNNCARLRRLPAGLSVGSVSLRNCAALETLPEGFSTWFLDLTACHRFAKWPVSASIGKGGLILQDCGSITELPKWLGRLSHLDLAGCSRISEVPNGVSVTSWVDIGGTGITSLPPTLQGAMLRWRGVRIDERIAFRPEELTAEEALAQTNAELRRVMIERMGYSRFASEARARVLDADRDPGGSRELLLINLQEDEPLVVLSCPCPSTARHYYLRVPPRARTCQEAAAWIAGFDDPKLYRPVIET